jgi:hypothetical protein
MIRSFMASRTRGRAASSANKRKVFANLVAFSVRGAKVRAAVRLNDSGDWEAIPESTIF